MMREEFGTLGKTILYYRKKAGLTQAQLAERLYTKKSDISEIENDKRSMTIPRLLDIADALQVHPAKLFAYIGQTIGSVRGYGACRYGGTVCADARKKLV